MIIVRSPLRISLGGGGTDLPSYYQKHGGYVLSAAIDKYVYVAILPTFSSGITLKYSELEKVKDASEVRHPILREALRIHGPGNPHIEISTFADIPAATGLGGSGSFTTALIAALYAFDRRQFSKEEVAQESCHIEMDILKEPIGKQDQYIAAYGGLTEFTFMTDNFVQIAPLAIPKDVLWELEDNLLLFFTGYTHSAAAVLADQDQRTKYNDAAMVGNLHYTKDLGYRSTKALQRGDLRGFAGLMNEHWEHKRQRSPGMTNSRIDELFMTGIHNGAIGGKLVGAGGGGFLLFYTEKHAQLRAEMKAAGCEEVRFRFDFEGVKQIMS